MEFELHGSVDGVIGLAPVEIVTDTTTVTAVIDTQGFESFEWLLMSGVITDGAYTTLLEEDDASGFGSATTVVAADQIGADIAYALGEDGVAKRVGVVGKKRYQRLSIISTATTLGGYFSVEALLSHAKSRPVA